MGVELQGLWESITLTRRMKMRTTWFIHIKIWLLSTMETRYCGLFLLFSALHVWATLDMVSCSCLQLFCSHASVCHVFWQIIQVNLTQDNLQPIKAGKTIELTYAVKWVETNTSYARRFDAYLDYPFFEHQVCQKFSLTYLHLVFGSDLWRLVLTGLKTVPSIFGCRTAQLLAHDLWRGL